MKKKISYLIVFLIGLICFNKQVFAESYKCNYVGVPNGFKGKLNGTEINYYIHLNFDINDGKLVMDNPIKDLYVDNLNYSQNIFPFNCKDQEKIEILNWDGSLITKDLLNVEYGKEYVKNNSKCPPYVILINSLSNYQCPAIVYYDEKSFNTLAEYLNLVSIDSFETLELNSLIGKEINIEYLSNNGEEKKEIQKITFDRNIKSKVLQENKFTHESFYFEGWMVSNGSGWLCNDGKEYVIGCPEDKRIILKDKANLDFYINSSTIYLHAKWQLLSNISPIQINNTNLGEDVCVKKGYVWNKEGYCNTDNLQYVMCGDAQDIPAQIPSLISMAVNLLKIATPIVLIIVSIITLVKAIMSSKEDEIKKAQQSLIRKVIAAVIIFMIVSIVQFVVLKVADDDDQTSISSCIKCFLDNNCRGVKYFKTNISGEYSCTKVNNPSESMDCESFYKSTPNYNKIPDVVIPQNTN